MRFMLLQHFVPAENCDLPMYQWKPQDIHAHIAYLLLQAARVTRDGCRAVS